MRQKFFLAAVLFIFIIGLTGGSISAEMRAGAITVNPNVGGYVFEGKEGIDNDVTYGLGLGYGLDENWAAEFSFNYVDTRSDPPDSDDVKAYLYHVDGLYHFVPESRLVPYLAAGVGAITIDGGRNDGTEPLVNYGAGVKYFITKDLVLRGDVRHILTGEPVNNFIYTAGLTYMFGGKAKEAAPPVEEPARPGPVDSDGDGVPDEKDRCPDTPKGVPVDEYGCPLDSDRDGVPDYLDKCPDTPKGVQVDEYGCPLDSDGDGVPDYLDKCPDTPKGVQVDADGCPPPARVIQLDNVYFEFDRATLTNEAKAALDKNTSTLSENPGIKVRIEGHACAHGEEDYNIRLSEKRVNSVREYLVNGGIPADRLTVISYGETRLAMPEVPTPRNKNSQEAKANRRVVFVVIMD